MVLCIEGDVSCNGRPCKGMTKRRAMEERLWSHIATLKMDINMADITEKTENCELVANCDRLVAVDNIEPLIKVIRGQQVMLDRDLATLYGVETKRLNEHVKRNIKRFPEDFMFQLTKDECLRSQIATLNAGRGQFYGENRFSVQPLGNYGILIREKAGFHGQVAQNQ